MPDPLNFLSGGEGASAESAVIEEAPAAAPARDAGGRLASSTAEPEPADPPAHVQGEASAADQKPDPGHVPVTALLDEREKRQKLERELEGLRAAQPPAEPGEPRYLDPDTENALLQLRLNTSEELVRDKEGDETVDAAKTWAIERFKTNPAYQAEVLAKPNPYKFVVAEYKAHLKVEATRDIDLTDLDAFKAWKAAGGNAAPPAPAPQAAVIAAPPPPPRSLASAPTAGGAVDTGPQGPGTAFDAMFKR